VLESTSPSFEDEEHLEEGERASQKGSDPTQPYVAVPERVCVDSRDPGNRH